MGESKQRRLRERATLLKVLDLWSKEPSAGEMETLAAIRSLPIVGVERDPADRLAFMRMDEGLCHSNCAWFEQNDPSRAWKAITGWIVDSATGNYILHAVIRSSRGEYRCITPMPYVSATHFDFIPDPCIITTHYDDNSFHHLRNGHVLGVGVRPDPVKTIADIEAARARIEAGDDPIKVLHSLSNARTKS